MAEGMFFQYTQLCPECEKNGIHDSHLGFETGTGSVHCGNENPHYFDKMPGETGPEEVSAVGSESVNFEDANPATTEIEKAVEGARLEEIVHRDDLPTANDLDAIALDEQIAQVTAPQAYDFSQCCVCRPGDAEGHYCDAHVPAALAPLDGLTVEEYERKVSEATAGIVLAPGQVYTRMTVRPDPFPIAPGHAMVGLGGVARLENGDVLCGIKIPETWVSAMQAEAENREPAISIAEYLQELIDQGLLEMYSTLPAAK